MSLGTKSNCPVYIGGLAPRAGKNGHFAFQHVYYFQKEVNTLNIRAHKFSGFKSD